MEKKSLQILGAAWGDGAGDHGCAAGPYSLQQSLLISQPSFHWRTIIDKLSLSHKLDKDVNSRIAALCQQLAQQTEQLYREHQPFLTIGGDHTCAIGTWSGVFAAIEKQGPLGLIWFDAHMDSHTPQTTVSGNLHGMPLACLLGYGNEALTHLMTPTPKLQPHHVCLIGVRSFEAGEAALLQSLNVRIFFMEEVEERGLAAVFQEAHQIVTHGTQNYGISIDLDAIDPLEAPGVGSPEPHGLNSEDLIETLQTICGDPRLIGAEIAEFNPEHDIDHRTALLIEKLATALFIQHTPL
jgi:arginase